MRENCQKHPEARATAWCLRYNRSFCDLDFDQPGGVECLSPGPFCKFRDQCFVWARMPEEAQRKKMKESRQQAAAEAEAEARE